MKREDPVFALSKLRRYVEKEGFKGYDPYDTLNAKLPLRRLGNWLAAAAIQVQKRNPVNIRPLLGIEKGYNPKALGLFLHAYSLLYEVRPKHGCRETADFLFRKLLDCHTRGYSGYCWGYNFPWASPGKFLPAFSPTVVVSGFVARGIAHYHRVLGSREALEALRGIGEFVLKDLHVSRDDDGACFSYGTLKPDCCYNAAMLGAELLARLYALSGEARYLAAAREVVDFVVHKQHPDGRWNYSIDLKTGREREQIDFHQGYVLDSLASFLADTGLKEEKYTRALALGADYYKRRQFLENGRSMWRLPAYWPVDIHHQAQGVLTFTRLAHLDPSYLDFAAVVADWTVAHMQDKSGYFYYRKHRLLTDKTSYMRWANAWMFLALVELIQKQGDRS